LHGLSTGDFAPALRDLLGEDAAAGLSAGSISRLTEQWQAEHATFREGSQTPGHHRGARASRAAS